MNNPVGNVVYDDLIIGSGSAGATLARELSAQGRRVLILERGEQVALKETIWGTVSILNEVKVAHKLKDPRVFAAGGSTAMYLAVAELPPFDAFRSAGIDLAVDFEVVKRELPLAEMPDEMLSPQTRCLRDVAVSQGHAWTKNLMLVDHARSGGRYDYESKWKALAFLEDAIRNGAELQCQAVVERVLVENGTAVGVACRLGSPAFRARRVEFRAERIHLCAGSLETPVILRRSGFDEAVAGGYYIDPSIAVIGRVPGLSGIETFAGSMGTTLDDGTKLLDANVHRFYFNMGMLQSLRPWRIPAFPEHVSIMIKAHDTVGGGLGADGRYHKDIDAHSIECMHRGLDVAKRIMSGAGARAMFVTPMMTGGVFGTLRIGEDVDDRLETRIRNLHVCDGSLIPASARVAPTLTLVCLAKYLARRLSERQVVDRQPSRAGIDAEAALAG